MVSLSYWLFCYLHWRIGMQNWFGHRWQLPTCNLRGGRLQLIFWYLIFDTAHLEASWIAIRIAIGIDRLNTPTSEHFNIPTWLNFAPIESNETWPIGIGIGQILARYWPGIGQAQLDAAGQCLFENVSWREREVCVCVLLPLELQLQLQLQLAISSLVLLE